MRRFATLATAAVAALALAVPTASVAQAAPGLPGAAAAAQSTDSAGLPGTAESFKPKKGKNKGNKLKVKKSAKGVQPGVSVLKLTVKAKGKGKVKFSVSGTAGSAKGKAKIKNGKAKFTVPALNTGDYKVKAKYGKLKGKTKFRVYASALTFTTPTTFTISKSQLSSTLPRLAGTVSFKDTVPNQGYIDIYPLGSALGSANTITFVGVGAADERPAGTWDFATGSDGTGNSFLSAVRSEYPVGTHQFQAYYTFDSDFVDYLTSSVITVTVTD